MTRRFRLAAASVAGAVLLAACGGTGPIGDGPESAPAVVADPAPVMIGEPAPDADLLAGSLPLALTGMPVLDPGWDQVPQELDALMLGLVHPPEDAGAGEPLRFVAAREDGTLLWEAQRPPSCTGFALSRGPDGPVAVLTDVAAGAEALTQTLASGYDLATGELLWGPNEVPGPHQGPGAVFAAPAPGAAMGETGPRVVLDPATGDVVATEEDGVVVIGEYGGVVLTATDGVLTASGAQQWSVPLADLDLGSEPAALPTAPPHGAALIGADGERSGTLLDLDTGEVLAEDVVSAARELQSGTLVTAGPELVSGYPETGESWQREIAGARIDGAANVFAYVRTGNELRVLNAVTGADAVAFDGDVPRPAVPVLATANGAVVVDAGDLALVPSVS